MPASKQNIINLVILPIEVEVMDCVASILEVTKLKYPGNMFQAAVQVKCNENTSQVFHIRYFDARELETKLALEVSKFKYMLYLYGKDEMKRRGLVL